MTEDDIYTTKVATPQYDVKGENPALTALVDDTKTKALLEEIDGAELPAEIKDFLRLAAYRHLVFDYHNIAEYYAHASEAVQDLMERSALVIIDYEDAIAGGYVRLKSELDAMLEEALADDAE